MKKLITEDAFAGFATPSATVRGAAVNGSATTAMRSDAAPTVGPGTHDLDVGWFRAVNAAEPSVAAPLTEWICVDSVAPAPRPKEPQDAWPISCVPR